MPDLAPALTALVDAADGLNITWATITERGQRDRMAAIAVGIGEWDEPLARRALLDRGLDPVHHRTRP